MNIIGVFFAFSDASSGSASTFACSAPFGPAELLSGAAFCASMASRRVGTGQSIQRLQQVCPLKERHADLDSASWEVTDERWRYFQPPVQPSADSGIALEVLLISRCSRMTCSARNITIH